jgi:hypothetical protein
VSPEHEAAVFHFAGGQVEIYSDQEVVLAKLDSGVTHEFSLGEVAADLADSSFEQSSLIFQLKSAISDPTAARSFHSENFNSSWGLPSGSGGGGPVGPPGGNIGINGVGLNPPFPNCELSDPLCDIYCQPHCHPAQGAAGIGSGWWLQRGFGDSPFGDDSEERECAAQHYRDWLHEQGDVCDDAIEQGVRATATGTVAAGACITYRNAPNYGTGLACAGSYVLLVLETWSLDQATDECIQDYPGPGGDC